jgi:glycosyltransferase involved in cell wall biosynthesis
MKRIKVFLGGYINYTNAQNLNCRAIAEHLNKDQFEIYTLKVHFGYKKEDTLKSFNCFKPFSITKHFGFFWGIINCNVAYLPKHIDTPFWVLKLANWLNKPIFTTIEGNVTDLSRSNLTELFRSQQRMERHFSCFNAVFGISKQLINSTNQVLSMREIPLSLGVTVDSFSHYNKERLSSIIFVGGLIKRKRVYEFIALAELYPNIQFRVIGEGAEKENLQIDQPLNVTFLGRLHHKELDIVFSSSDLLFLPSKSEGFPKVILEAASAGIPSIVYDSYGASDWIDNKNNGFVVSAFNQIQELLDELLENPILLKKVSGNTHELAYRFDWKDIINDWETIIRDLYNGK